MQEKKNNKKKTALLFNANATLIFFSRLSAKYRFDSQYIFRLKNLSFFFFTLLLRGAHFLFIRLFFFVRKLNLFKTIKKRENFLFLL